MDDCCGEERGGDGEKWVISGNGGKRGWVVKSSCNGVMNWKNG